MTAENATLPPGLLLAEIDGVSYLQLTGVFTAAGPTLAYYCAAEAWDGSEAAGEAARRTRIAQLRAELAELEGRPVPPLPSLPSLPATPVAGEPAEVAELRAALEAPPSPSTDVRCPECGRPWKNELGLSVHRARAHGVRGAHVPPAPKPKRAAAAPAAPAPRPPLAELIVDDKPFRCPTCRSDAFTESVREPGRCVRCTGEFEQATRRAA